MADMLITKAHNTSEIEATAKMRTTVDALHAQYKQFIEHIDWSEDYKCAKIDGRVFTFELNVTQHDVIVTATLKGLAAKLARGIITDTINAELSRAYG